MARFRPRCGWKLSPRIREGGCSRRPVALAAPTLVAGVVIAYRLVRNGDEVQDGNHYEGQCGQISAYPEKQRYAGFPRFCRVGCLGDVRHHEDGHHQPSDTHDDGHHPGQDH